MRAKPIAGRYELVEQLDAGGMGQVWRGYDAVLDREVAVKLIRPDVISMAEQAEELALRFRREARVTARIQHHGVPQVYDAVLDRSYDRMYLVMEFVRGTSLRAFINPRQPLPIAWAAAITAQICTVLSHAHAVPVVHRDLKPGNVLVTDAGAVKVLDFGIAAILRTDVTRLTATGSPLGTSRYMPPEQIQGADHPTQRPVRPRLCAARTAERTAADHVPTGMPDPTLLYRRPNSPHPRPETPPLVPAPATPPTQPDAAPATGLRDAIAAAVAHSDHLLDDERFAQAAEVLQQVITPAAAALGAENPRVLRLRSRRAAILIIGGDFRRALPEFDALAAAYARTAGPTSQDALDCLRQAAYCRAELGEATAALQQFQQVLTHVRVADGDASPTALDLRRNIGMLLLSEGKAADAAAELQPLYEDLCVVYGPQHEEAQEVADALARIKLSNGRMSHIAAGP